MGPQRRPTLPALACFEIAQEQVERELHGVARGILLRRPEPARAQHLRKRLQKHMFKKPRLFKQTSTGGVTQAVLAAEVLRRYTRKDT